MSLIVKICGLSTPEALDAALDARADMVGFVFFEPSPRHLEPLEAKLLGRRVQGRAKKVALTVDADDKLLATIVAALSPDFLQLHGNESPERVAAIKAQFKLPIIKALPIEARRDFSQAQQYDRAGAWLLLDAKPPTDATRPGGLGSPFDWSLIGGFDFTQLRGAVPGVPVILSGGLDAENIENALRVTGVAAVDVSSGVESSPGQKDIKKIRDFIRRAREAHQRVNSRRVASKS
jgi:phosphoribosylanthranilate isomerase